MRKNGTMTSGVVTNYLVGLIAKQVDDKGLVVWYDPEQAYLGVVDQLGQRTTDHGPLTTARHVLVSRRRF
jgi:hypothetical protein